MFRFTHARCRATRSGELNLAIILICIVVVFVICNVLRYCTVHCTIVTVYCITMEEIHINGAVKGGELY